MMAALAMGFAACSDDDYAPAQSNAQEAVMDADGIAVAYSSVAGEDANINFNDYNADVDPAKNRIPVLDITKLENLPSNFTVENCIMEYSVDEKFAEATTQQIVLTTDGMTLYAPTDAWNTAHIALYTKNPRPTTGAWIRFIVNAVNGSSVVRLGAPYYAAHALGTITPLPAEKPVADSYQVVMIDGTVKEMNPANPANVYDPPTFSLMIEVDPDQAPMKVKVRGGGKTYGAASYDEETTTGTLGEDAEDYILIPAGPQLLEINAEELTFKTGIALEEIYAWVRNNSGSAFPLYNSNYIEYRGWLGARQLSISFVNDPSSVKYEWGVGEEEGTLLQVVAPDAPATIDLPARGLYWIDVNLPALTYKVVPVESLEICGTMTNWQSDPAYELTGSGTYSEKWKVTCAMQNGQMFKIRANHDWDSAGNVGGTFDEVRPYGKHMEWTAGDGIFEITYDVKKATITWVQK